MEHSQAAIHSLKTQRTCKRLLKLEVALWPFLQHEGVEPTNNMAERTIRRYVLWRKQSFGTQSERGDRYIERIMTVVATCRLQHRNPLDYLTAAVVAYQRRACPPTLLPDEMPARAAA